MKTAGSILLLLWLPQTIFSATKTFLTWYITDVTQSLSTLTFSGGKSQLINVSKNATRFLFTVKFRHTEQWILLICHKRKQCFQETLLTKLDNFVAVGIVLLAF